MSPHLEDALRKEYPRLFMRLDYFDCGDGWFRILWDLGKDLEPIRGVTAEQVKEKFGGLRFYVNDDEQAGPAIRTAETRSLRTCEQCGSPGSQSTTGGWIRTLCTKCLNRLVDQ